jgi:hypothetical protein
MATLKNLIPKDKFDEEAVEKLYEYTFDELEPIMSDLLEWLQDGNWPVSRPLHVFLLTLPADKLGPYLMKILEGTDYDWKYFLISFLGHRKDGVKYEQFINEIKRIAENPTAVERGCELDEIAQFALE